MRGISPAGVPLISVIVAFFLVSGFHFGLRAGEPVPVARTTPESPTAEARDSAPLTRIRGVVTWEVPGFQGLVFVHDGANSVLVARTNMQVHLQPGDFLEVEGRFAPGQFKEMLREATVQKIGSEPLPRTLARTARQLASGIHFGEWVKLECLVHDAGLSRGDLILQVTSKTQPFYAYVTVPSDFEVPANLVDSVVELSGVVWTLAGPDQKPYGFRLHVPATNWMQTLRPGTVNFFDRPVTTSRQLRMLEESQDDHVRVRGTITRIYEAQGPYRIVLEDPTGPVAAYLHVPIGRDHNVAPYWRDDPAAVWNSRPEPPPVKLGDHVEVVGSPSAEGEAVPLLHGAEFQVLGYGPPVTPREVRATEALSPDLDHALVSLTARVLDCQKGKIGQQPLVTFWVQSDGMVFEARLQGKTLPDDVVPVNGLAEFTGLALPVLGQTGKPRGLQLDLRSRTDIRLLKEPSPLFGPAVLRWFGISTGALLLALFWVWMLRRQVARRTVELATSVAQKERAEVELIKALERERELGQLKSNFVSVVSHEFRTPLGVIVSSADILRRYLDRLSPDKRREQLDAIQRATQNLSNLVEDVLLLGKVEAGKLRFVPEPINLAALCRNLVDEILSATNRVCLIQFTQIGSVDGAVGDENLLRPILSNLLSNAVKYSYPGALVEFEVARVALERSMEILDANRLPKQDKDCGAPPNAPASLDRREGQLPKSVEICKAYVQFTVRDKGIGISPEDQKRLFEVFTRGNNVGERPGTGLGLVIVKRCVELHGGTIQLDSALGSGTVLTVRLPMFNSA